MRGQGLSHKAIRFDLASTVSSMLVVCTIDFLKISYTELLFLFDSDRKGSIAKNTTLVT